MLVLSRQYTQTIEERPKRNYVPIAINISAPCLDFHELIKSNNQLLRSIHGSQKYKWKHSEQPGAAAKWLQVELSGVD